MGNIIKKLGAFSIGPIAAAFLGFLTVPLITYFITPEEYGKASMFTLAQGIASMLVYFGLDQAFVREFHVYKDKLNALLSNAIFVPLFFVSVLGIIIIINANWMSRILFDSSNEKIAVYMLSIMLPFMVIENFAFLTIRMNEKGLQYSLSTISLKVLVLIITVLLFFVYERSFRSVVYAMAIAEIVNGIILFFAVIYPQKISLYYLDKDLIKGMLKFGLPLIPAMMMSWILASMDKVMLRIMCGYGDLGLYTAAYKIVSAVGIVQSCFTIFWTPVAYRWHEENVKKDSFEAVNMLVAVGMSVICLILLLVKNLVGIVLGDDFIQAIQIFPFLLLYPVMYTMSETTAVGIGFSRKTHYSIIVSGVSGIVNIFLNYILIPLWGGIGAAVATGIAFVIFFWTRTMLSRKVWWNFPIGIYFVVTIILTANCYVHTFIKVYSPYIVSISSVVILIIIYYKPMKSIVKKLKSFENV